ncbi:helix-turn-helix domain-containing protein [Corynebacterium amycolatum]|uniref:helix-turn-helix domain-containing protein n=1 Tax=Corynebacterium amycolatum TaxID=43765 RepID=UPI002551BDAC|nr:helix-turn-helix domain-containing protein [Corynebacterium amycolatum]MDK8819042.1 helix-turn-helix domain-containing protein [Corynebacterium amycolatum]
MTAPPTIPVPVAARLLGMSKSSVYRAIRTGNFPTAAHQVNGRYVIATRPLLEFLGLETLPEWAHTETDTDTPRAA